MSRRLVIKLTHGAEAGEIMSAGLTVAATAAASGTPVSLWLTAEATWLGVPGRADAEQLAQSAPPSDLLAAVLTNGTVTVCAQCASRRGLAAGDLLDGVRIAGAATFVEEVLHDDVTALIY
jgi:predicted peroxiredoxin